ncbi:MAG: bifunctional biotin--[acetyl-CoA-carboxylase] ligase/biotin operon repressor BirA [Gammaproteobacteria bacterium]|nr:bifunctional biotin--[acetyl-CoA-carboxylase] ligase/biotin operon repressor BirA [Gammaproteobacteria bacterium]NVK87267.1 bifunctional biotin--[acetyl-CoA-carboxylase] ligase/biotin operon repressor BirA [Gammaproteobacteria bacterium]
MAVETIIRLLSDGKFHSGESIAKQLEVSRTAIWKYIQQLKTLGVDVYSVSGKGYRLAQALELLDVERISDSMRSGTQQPFQLDVFQNIASTNQILQSLESREKFHFCLSEYQSMGRGRQGKRWHSPFARNIYLSVKTQIQRPPEQLSGLSIAIGLMLAQLFQRLGVQNMAVKWPNDLKINDQKVGGILVELTSAKRGEVIIGVGLNWQMDNQQQIDQAWTNLAPNLPHLGRNDVVIAMALQLIEGLQQFELDGLTHFLPQWPLYDWLANQTVELSLGPRKVYGIARGIDATGALLVEDDTGIKPYVGGEVSARLRHDPTA